jgi:hypothetical protein
MAFDLQSQCEDGALKSLILPNGADAWTKRGITRDQRISQALESSESLERFRLTICV